MRGWWFRGTVAPSSITTINSGCSDVVVRSIMTSGVATESDTGDAGDSLNLTCVPGGCGCAATLDIIRSTPTIGSTADAGDSFAQSATAMSIIFRCTSSIVSKATAVEQPSTGSGSVSPGSDSQSIARLVGWMIRATANLYQYTPHYHAARHLRSGRVLLGIG